MIIITVITLLMMYFAIDLDTAEKISEKTVQVEIRGEIEKPGVYELSLGSTYEDLFALCEIKESGDISGLSLQKVLANKEVIVIPEKKNEQLISINSADLETLMRLPGIGEKIAQRIIDYRQNNGRFNSLQDLMKVSGIGESKYQKIKDLITL